MPARVAEKPSEGKRDMVKYKKSHSDFEKEPAGSEKVVLFANGNLETREPPGDRSGANLWRIWKKKYLAIFVVLGILSMGIILAGVFARKESTPWAAAPNSTAPPPCPPGWDLNKGRCYSFSDDEAPWNASQGNCSSQGGSLMTMEDPQERDFILRHKKHIYVWIGLWRENAGQPWKRPNGSLFNDGFPIQGEGSCAYLNEVTIRSTWCTSSRFWICSKPALAAGVMLRTLQPSKG